MDYLIFSLGEGDEGIATLEAMASTRPADHGAAMAEVERVLDWARRRFPDEHGPVEEGMTWDHEVLVRDEEGGWRTVALTLTGSPHFVDAFAAEFGDPAD